MVDYEPRPRSPALLKLTPAAPQLHEAAPGNLALHWRQDNGVMSNRPLPKPQRWRGWIWSITASS